MPNYEIIEFYYQRYGEDTFKSKEKLKQTILKDDSKGTAKSWIDHPTNWFTTKGPKGQVLGEKVGDVNDEYIGEVRNEIDRANTEVELNKISIDTEYEDDTQAILEGQIGEKLDGLTDEIEEMIKDLEGARTVEEIDETIGVTPGVGSTKKKYGREIGDRLSQAIADAALRKYDIEHGG